MTQFLLRSALSPHGCHCIVQTADSVERKWYPAKNGYATKYFHATQHPVMQSAEAGEDWRWCYIDNRMM